MNKITKIILFTLIALFIVGIIVYPTIKKQLKEGEVSREAPDSKGSSGGSRGKSLNVNVKIIKPETLTDIFRFTAMTIPDEEVDLSFESSGKITGIFFKEGSSVKKGELLAKVNDLPLQAELQKLQAQIPLAEDRVFRQKSLLEKDAVSKEAYEQVTTELDKLNADIELTKSKIAQTELLAPFDGIVGLRNISEGAYASPSTIITSLTKIIPLKIEFSVNEKQADNIYPGMEITFQPDADISVYKANIYAKETRVDPKLYSLKVRALYPNLNGSMRPGRSASVEVRSNSIDNALTAPSESIIKEMGRDIAYIYSAGKAKQVILDIGMRTESSVQIINGLNSGDTLIVSGVMQLRDGLPVTIDNFN